MCTLKSKTSSRRIGFTKQLSLISATDAKSARNEVTTGFLLFNIGIIFAEVNFYVANIKGRKAYEGASFADDMLTLCATYREGSGDTGKLTAGMVFLKEIFDDEEIATLQTYDDVWSQHVVKRFQNNHNPAAVEDDDAPVQIPIESLHHHMYVKLWMATRAFTERNFVLKTEEIRRTLEVFKENPTSSNVTRAVQAIGKYIRMFNELWMEKFVAISHFYEKMNADGGVEAAYEDARRLLLSERDEKAVGNALTRIGLCNRALQIMGAGSADYGRRRRRGV